VDLKRFVPSRPQHEPEDFNRSVRLPDHPVQVRPAAHAVNGGVLINERAESSLPGLFALAEAAAGPHGADRLGGCMVSNGQVFGARAGRFAAELAATCGGAGEFGLQTLRPLAARLQCFGRGDRQPDEVLAALQQATGRHLIVLRHQASLETLLGRIKELAVEQLPEVAASTPAALKRAVEVSNALTTAELMACAALLRTESRGSHYREDHPQQDDARWRTNLIFRQDCTGTHTSTRSLEHERQPV